MNKLAVLYTHEIGHGHSSLEKFGTVYGMPVMNIKSYWHMDKQINCALIEQCEATLGQTAEKVKEVYGEVFPAGRGDEDGAVWETDDVPWVDVSFDGSWHKRGFTSHHGIGVVADMLTGYILDYEVLCTYCHVCEMNKAKLQDMTEEEREAWREEHAAECQINHEGSSKSMEKADAVNIFSR